MVKILDNGDIVADDDPRAQQRASSHAAGEALRRRDRESRTGVDGGLGANAYRGPHTGSTSDVSLFDAANGRLLAAGIPRVPLGYRNIVIEPLVGVGIILALLFFGLPGLFLVVFIFIVRELSTGEGPVHETLSRWLSGSTTPSSSQNSRPPGPGPSGGSGGGGAPRKTPQDPRFKGQGHRLAD